MTKKIHEGSSRLIPRVFVPLYGTEQPNPSTQVGAGRGQEWPTKYAGKPTPANIEKFIVGYYKSTKPGGANDHIGAQSNGKGWPVQPPARAYVFDQTKGEIVGQWTAPKFWVIENTISIPQQVLNSVINMQTYLRQSMSLEEARKKAASFKRSDCSVETWFERDRAHVSLECGGETVAEWWDDEVQDMADSGYFTMGKGDAALERSVLDYAVEQGLISESATGTPQAVKKASRVAEATENPELVSAVQTILDKANELFKGGFVNGGVKLSIGVPVGSVAVHARPRDQWTNGIFENGPSFRALIQNDNERPRGAVSITTREEAPGGTSGRGETYSVSFSSFARGFKPRVMNRQPLAKIVAHILKVMQTFKSALATTSTSESRTFNNTQVFNAYVEAALWSSTDDEGEPLDASYEDSDRVSEATENPELVAAVQTILDKANELFKGGFVNGGVKLSIGVPVGSVAVHARPRDQWTNGIFENGPSFRALIQNDNERPRGAVSITTREEAPGGTSGRGETYSVSFSSFASGFKPRMMNRQPLAKIVAHILKVMQTFKSALATTSTSESRTFNNTQVFNAYVEAALWSSTDDEGEPLDASYDNDDIAPSTLRSMRKDVDNFIKYVQAQGISTEGWSAEQFGHDFWLSRNGHGAGFFDRSGPSRRKLQDAAKTFGDYELYVGDDGKVYAMQESVNESKVKSAVGVDTIPGIVAGLQNDSSVIIFRKEHYDNKGTVTGPVVSIGKGQELYTALAYGWNSGFTMSKDEHAAVRAKAARLAKSLTKSEAVSEGKGWDYDRQGPGLLITAPDGRTCFLQGDEASELEDQLDKTKNQRQIDSILDAYDDVCEAALEYAVWGIPPGEKEEDLLVAMPNGKPITSKSQAEKYKAAAIAKGAKSVRIQTVDLSTPPDFGQFREAKESTMSTIADQALAEARKKRGLPTPDHWRTFKKGKYKGPIPIDSTPKKKRKKHESIEDDVSEISTGARTAGFLMSDAPQSEKDKIAPGGKSFVEPTGSSGSPVGERIDQFIASVSEAEKLTKAELILMDRKRAKRERRGKGHATGKQRLASKRNAKKAARALLRGSTQRKRDKTAKRRAKLRGN